MTGLTEKLGRQYLPNEAAILEIVAFSFSARIANVG